MESSTKQKSKAGRWIHLGRFALLIRGTAEKWIISTRHSYRKSFWRFYRTGPGLPAPILTRMIADELALMRAEVRRKTLQSFFR